MLQHESRLKIVDNSGAKEALCIHIAGSTRKRWASIGDVIIGTIKEASSTGKVKKKEVHHIVIVRTTKEIARPDGSYIRFDDNAGVLITPDGNLIGNSISGPVARELRAKFMKIVSIADEAL